MAEPTLNPETAEWCRRLLQRQGVPLMFSAEQLWEQGFRGAGVKMGVFDTGIRSDHPHVKNIRCAALGSVSILAGPIACQEHRVFGGLG